MYDENGQAPAVRRIGVDLFCFHYCATSGTQQSGAAFGLFFHFSLIVMRKNPVQLIYIMFIAGVQLHTYGLNFIGLDYSLRKYA